MNWEGEAPAEPRSSVSTSRSVSVSEFTRRGGRQRGRFEVKVDPDLCTGCGLCEEVCPEVFEVVDNVAHVKANPVPPAAEKTCRQAADDCPTEAIVVEE